MLPKFSKKAVCYMTVLIFIVPFVGLFHTDREGRSFEKKVLQALGDKESIEIPIAHLMPSNWHVVTIARNNRYMKKLKSARDGAELSYIYSLHFQDTSGKVLKKIILPLRFAKTRDYHPFNYTSIPYVVKEKFGRDAKFKIKRMPNTYRDGGNELEIELK